MIALVYLFNLQEFVRERERDALRLVQVNVELLGKYRTRLESSIYYTTKLDVYIHCIQKKNERIRSFRRVLGLGIYDIIYYVIWWYTLYKLFVHITGYFLLLLKKYIFLEHTWSTYLPKKICVSKYVPGTLCLIIFSLFNFGLLKYHMIS